MQPHGLRIALTRARHAGAKPYGHMPRPAIVKPRVALQIRRQHGQCIQAPEQFVVHGQRGHAKHAACDGLLSGVAQLPLHLFAGRLTRRR